MNALFPSILKILSLVGSLIMIAEDALGPGTGDEKKAKVIADVQARLPGLAGQLGIPEWAVAVFSNPGVLGFIIDSLVTIAAANGHLPPSPAAASSTSS